MISYLFSLKEICKTNNFAHAVFLMFSSYTFYLEYPPPVKALFWFLQDYIFSYSDSSNQSPSYLATVSDIKHCLVNSRLLSKCSFSIMKLINKYPCSAPYVYIGPYAYGISRTRMGQYYVPYTYGRPI